MSTADIITVLSSAIGTVHVVIIVMGAVQLDVHLCINLNAALDNYLPMYHAACAHSTRSLRLPMCRCVQSLIYLMEDHTCEELPLVTQHQMQTNHKMTISS